MYNGTSNTDNVVVPDVDPRRRVDQPAAEGRYRLKKRIIVCCDGTWQDGLIVSQRWKYTNVLKLARAINHLDERTNPPIHQIVFYQSGIATEDYAVLRALDGVVGATLADKVQEAYAFLAHSNYLPGDEIFLFGFSRGAYTARMVAELIGGIGVLSRTDMDHFADIFVAYQKRGKTTDEKEKRELDEKLRPWTHPQSVGKVRATMDGHGYSIRCTLFGFPDKHLGLHIGRAYQALGIDEHRKDFDCAKFEQMEEGRAKGQILKQCWFTGCHSDIGGGYEEHDLSDIALGWLAANLLDILSLDLDYLLSLPDPVAPWGEQSAHNSMTGVYTIADKIQRTLPTVTDDVTHETVHASVLQQPQLNPTLQDNIKKNPLLVTPLLPLEEEIRNRWKVNPAKAQKSQKESEVSQQSRKDDFLAQAKGVLGKGEQVIQRFSSSHTEIQSQTTSDGHWIGRVAEEHHVGVVVKELLHGFRH
ncbi:hypothetical protein C8Q75DRAFT_234182 [Abortiporus biennis]|nr:hypothetical protein C8Q75DRAFT_234182 [Abortiporus biennis]